MQLISITDAVTHNTHERMTDMCSFIFENIGDDGS